jgi:hypothetical protein
MLKGEHSAPEIFPEQEKRPRLSQRRVDRIDVDGPLLKSKLAWKVATYQQSILYRLVMWRTGVPEILFAAYSLRGRSSKPSHCSWISRIGRSASLITAISPESMI